MRALLTLITVCCLSCQNKSPDVVVTPPSADTTQYPLYPNKVTYNGTLHLHSEHEADSSGYTTSYVLDTFFQNPPVTVEYPNSDSLIITFGYWDCTGATGNHQLYYNEVNQVLKTSSTNTYEYDQHYSHRYSQDTLRNDSLVFSSSNHAGLSFHETMLFRGKKR